ncbi:MAG: alpha/beta hydrolase [Candidatus Eremiobacteraeota bacterium]|nr:alpha/beta hydrolase [Candidatus Eremiobacteraeota bacterium]
MTQLVFIHGAGCTPSVFAQQLAAFPGSTAPLLPGHGTPGEPATIAEFADAVALTLERNDLHDVVLAGSSMGGAIALELALRREPRVRAVVLLGSSGKLRVAPAIFDAIDRDFPGAARMLAGYFYAQPTEELLERSVAEMLAVGQAQTRRDFEACNTFDVLDRLGEIDVPLLVLSGEKDAMVSPKFSLAVADRVSGAQARIVEGTGHLLFIERPDDTNDALRTFVSSIDSLPSK